MPSYQRVHHHVAGTGVEGDHVFARAAGRNRRDVGDAADVERDASFARMAEQKIVHVRHQRSALAAGGDVARAKIGNHRLARALGDHGSLADLQRGQAAFVIDGLAVTADQLDGGERHAGVQNRVGVQLAEQDVEPRDFSRVRAGVRHGENHFADARRIWTRREAHQPVAAARDVDDGDVDAVQRSAAHQARNSHFRFSSSCRSLSSCSASMGRSSSSLRLRMRSAI